MIKHNSCANFSADISLFFLKVCKIMPVIYWTIFATLILPQVLLMTRVFKSTYVKAHISLTLLTYILMSYISAIEACLIFHLFSYFISGSPVIEPLLNDISQSSFVIGFILFFGACYITGLIGKLTIKFINQLGNSYALRSYIVNTRDAMEQKELKHLG